MQYEQNQMRWMWMRWAVIIYEMNGMEMNDKMNKLDFGI